MADRIKLRRGPKNKMDLNVYELGYVTDSNEKRLYFNDGSMVPIPNEKDITDIRAELTETTNVSEQNKKDVLELKESVADIVLTGVAKMVQYSYDIELSETTKIVSIPYEKYSSVTDTLKVYINGLAIQNDQYTITDPVENEGVFVNGYITLKVEKPAGTIVRIEVWKNVVSGEEGEVSGNIITQNSLPLDRIIGIDDITTQLNAKANNCYKIFENLDGKHIKFLGDSVSGGSGGTNCSYTGEPIGRTTNKKANDVGKCWVNSLRAYFEEKYSCTTKNWSVSGWKSSDIVKYLSELIEEDDDIIICAIGANNCYISDGIPKLESDIRTINDYCISRGKKIIYVGTIQTMTCANETHGIKMEDIDNCLRELCTKLNSYFIPMYNLFNDYILTCGYNYKWLYKDEEHPNDNGYNVMYYLIANYLGFYTDLEIRNKLYKLYDTGWINIPLQSEISVDDGLTPQCRRIGNTVMVRGSVAGITENKWTLLGSLPAGFRPTGQSHYYRTSMAGYIGAAISISTDGKLAFQGTRSGSASGWLVISTSFAID